MPHKVKVGNRTLITNTYAANNGNLTRSDYGNGDYVSYTYDNLDRVVGKAYYGTNVGRWNYNANGQVGLFEDLESNREYYYYYDDIGRLTRLNIQGTSSSSSDFYASLSTGYNSLDQTTGMSYTFAGQTKNVGYTYSDRDYWPETTTFNGSNSATNDYDTLGRLSKKTYALPSSAGSDLNAQYRYIDWSSDANRTTGTVRGIVYHDSDDSTLSIYDRYYTYDKNGNIATESVWKTDGNLLREKYTYDSKNQLTRHDSVTQNKSFTYEYDAAGNILSKKEYAYTTGTLGAATRTINYTYGDTSWGDLLTEYYGVPIYYDGIGNPVEYYLGWEMMWQGRSLMEIVLPDRVFSYTYTPDGIRNSKSANGLKTEFLLNGTQILAQKTGSNVMWFFYDSTGARVGLQYGNVTAYYMYNLQGDVIGLADAATGKVIAKYLYDAWGKCISVENASGYTIGTDNPFRYRGYYYDTETGFYYLNSRYYDPEVGRFLNADAFASTDISDVLSTNMFAYCENNPVNMADPNGCDPIPSWATRIIDGNATEADYKKALSVNPEGWGGHARYYVDKAVGLAREYCQKTGKTGVRVEQISSVAGIPIAFHGALGIATDKFGNKAIVITAGGGGGAGLSMSAIFDGVADNVSGLGAGVIEYENAIMVWEIAGSGTSSGVTIGPVSYGITICDATKDEVRGFSPGWGLEVHAVLDYTWLIPLNY